MSASHITHLIPTRINWSLENMEIKTWGVELALKPIIRTITSLMNTNRKPKRKKGCSKRSRSLVMAVEVATANFVEKGEIIAQENIEAQQDIMSILEDIRGHGKSLVLSSRDFAGDPCSTVKRSLMVKAAQDLVTSVTRLLILADMLDVHHLMVKVGRARQDLELMRKVGSQQELMEWMRRLESSLTELRQEAGVRQRELKDSALREELGASRAVLRRQTPLLLTSCNVSVRYPELELARQNRDNIHREICGAVENIDCIASGNWPEPGDTSDGQETLMSLLTDVRACLQNNPDSLTEKENKLTIESQLEKIVTKSMILAKSKIIKAESKKKITKTCEELMTIFNEKIFDLQEDVSSLRKSVNTLNSRVELLIRMLRKTAADQVSETFIDSLEPINQMLSTARKGGKEGLVKSSQLLERQIQDFSSLAETISDVTDNSEGRRLIKLSLTQLVDLKNKLNNAINIFSQIPDSKAAQENVQMFKKSWVDQVKIFMDAVDDVVCVNYFLGVVENNVLSDVKKCCGAMEDRDISSLVSRSRAIYQRCGRLCDVVTQDMERFEPGVFTTRVLEAVRVLRLDIMVVFSKRVSEVIKCARTRAEIDENEFIDACRMIYDGVRDVRYNYLTNVECEESGLDSDMEETVTKKESVPKEKTTIREAVSKIKSEDICAELSSDSPVYWVAVWSNPQVRDLLSSADLGGSQVDGFQEEKEKLDREVAKWEDNNNDIIVLAKHMCSIMSDMTDFIKGRGKLKTTSDIIDSARKISEAGKKLDVLARKIAERCPSTTTKSDLLAYLGRITLYCHQLTITSKVKADVHNVSGELVVSGLDSAMSLIQAAKNLMNAVVLTVKASYVASRMYRQSGDGSTCPPSPVVVWKMRTPEKLPLVRREHPEEFRAKVRKAASTRQTSPLRALSEFQQRFHDLSNSSSVSSVNSVCHVELENKEK